MLAPYRRGVQHPAQEILKLMLGYRIHGHPHDFMMPSLQLGFPVRMVYRKCIRILLIQLA